MKIIKRLGNLALCSTTSYSRKKHKYYEIVKYEPNTYYGRESDYDKVDEFNYRLKDNPWCYIHKSCFENPESCYTIGMFEKTDEGYDFRGIGNRIVLPESEWGDFLTLLKTFYKRRK